MSTKESPTDFLLIPIIYATWSVLSAVHEDPSPPGQSRRLSLLRSEDMGNSYAVVHYVVVPFIRFRSLRSLQTPF